jgi:hypothetical protein
MRWNDKEGNRLISQVEMKKFEGKSVLEISKRLQEKFPSKSVESIRHKIRRLFFLDNN